MTSFRYPTPEEVSALERAARRARADEVARLARLAVAGIRSLFGRAAPPAGYAQPLEPRIGH